MNGLTQSSYVSLPERCYAVQNPDPVAAPELLWFNDGLANELGVTAQLDVLAGNAVPEGCTPLAQAYAGHQFGGFVPQLGDGRALLLGEAKDAKGKHYDVQLKGSGRTPFSRNGDGRSALGPVVREAILSEAMHALDVPTTRALACVKTGERVQRETGLDGGILTRVASSHVRVGTCEYFAAKSDIEALKSVVDYAITRHDAELLENENKYLLFYESVIDRQASLVAKWMSLGFIHGVMNTDNTTLSGETIDYGPCAFMEAYDPATCFSAIDAGARYAYGNQPSIMQWNLTALGEALLPLFDENVNVAAGKAGDALSGYAERFAEHYTTAMRAKLGLKKHDASDRELIGDWLSLLQRNELDFTNSFSSLSRSAASTDEALNAVDASWFVKWRARLTQENVSSEAIEKRMKAANPLYIPRNHKVEEAIVAAYAGDMSVSERLMMVLSNPYEEQRGAEDYMHPAPANARIYQTFCGT